MSISRGAGGGCRLTADLKTVSLFDLVRIMEADRLVSACTQPCYECDAQHKHGVPCVTNRHFLQIQNVLDGELKKRNLYEILFEE